MQKVKLICAMGNDRGYKVNEIRTGYMLPAIHGLEFCVTRNDHADHRAIWSVSHYGTGFQAGPACHTRKDAVDAFITRFNSIVERNGIQHILDIVNKPKTINH